MDCLQIHLKSFKQFLHIVFTKKEYPHGLQLSQAVFSCPRSHPHNFVLPHNSGELMNFNHLSPCILLFHKCLQLLCLSVALQYNNKFLAKTEYSRICSRPQCKPLSIHYFHPGGCPAQTTIMHSFLQIVYSLETSGNMGELFFPQQCRTITCGKTPLHTWTTVTHGAYAVCVHQRLGPDDGI